MLTFENFSQADKLALAQREVNILKSSSVMVLYRWDFLEGAEFFFLTFLQMSAKENSMLNLKMEAHVLQQELTTERMKMEDVKASFAQQLKTVGGGSKDSEERAAKAEAELTELRLQLKLVREKAEASEAAKESESAVKMMKMKLQKAEIDKKSLQEQLDNKQKENQDLTKMCDELLSDLEKSKAT